jgi:hypothetical protein
MAKKKPGYQWTWAPSKIAKPKVPDRLEEGSPNEGRRSGGKGFAGKVHQTATLEASLELSQRTLDQVASQLFLFRFHLGKPRSQSNCPNF